MNIILEDSGIQGCDATLLAELLLPFLQNARNPLTQMTWHHIPEDQNPKVNCYENVKTHKHATF